MPPALARTARKGALDLSSQGAGLTVMTAITEWAPAVDLHPVTFAIASFVIGVGIRCAYRVARDRGWIKPEDLGGIA